MLTSLRLAGWKSIRDAEIEFRPLNVFIGANGAGKSNLVSFFGLSTEMRKRSLQVHIARVGGAESLLHYGSKTTSVIEAEMRMTTELGESDYLFRLIPAVGNTFVFENEQLEFHPKIQSGLKEQAQTPIRSSGGHRESELRVLFEFVDVDTDFDTNGQLIGNYLSACHVYHFHDTSFLSPMRRDCPINGNQFLHSDGSNLPAMLYLYRERYPTAYRQIVSAVKAIAPFFDDFVLEPLRLNPTNIALHWRAKGTSYEFGPHQLSDGTLRAIALCTLLLQPEEDRQSLIVLDEPELGLHPSALAVLADLLKAAARHSQIVVATQSTALIDHFDVEDIVTANLRDGASTFERLDPNQLNEWLEEYTVSELWERNVIGGGPY